MRKVDLKKRFLKEFQGLPRDLQREPLFLAVSGGMDSTVLAHVVISLRDQLPPIHFVYCNYHLRVPDSDKEEAFLSRWASKERIPLHIKRLFPKTKPKNLQEWARGHRYRFFSQVLGKQKDQSGLIVLAHHQRDQVETILGRMVRGSGLSGIGGMKVLDELVELPRTKLQIPLKLFRPFLSVPFEALERYASDHRLKYCVDLSNEGEDYLRNRLRHKLLPLFLEENPRFQETLTAFGKKAREAEKTLKLLASKWLKKNQRFKKEVSEIPFPPLERKEPGMRIAILEQFFLSAGLPSQGMERFLNAVAEHFDREKRDQKIPLRGKKELEISSKVVRISEKSVSSNLKRETRRSVKTKIPKEYRIKKSGVHFFPEINRSLEIKRLKSVRRDMFKNRDPNRLFLDPEVVIFPIFLTKAKNSDRFMPLGMKGSKSIRHFLKDRKVPVEKRGESWLLSNSQRIPLWLVGYRGDERGKLLPTSKGAYRVTWKRGRGRKY